MRTRLMQIADTCFFDSDGELSVGDLYGNTRNIIRCKTKQAYKGVYHAVRVSCISSDLLDCFCGFFLLHSGGDNLLWMTSVCGCCSSWLTQHSLTTG